MNKITHQTHKPLKKADLHGYVIVASILLLLGTGAGCAGLDDALQQFSAESSDPVPPPVKSGALPGDYYTILGGAETPYDAPAPGTITYCPLDSLSRAVCAVGELTSALRADAKLQERQDITVDPSGWPRSNNEVVIPALPQVPGSEDYSGWFWNRSHLIADSLGGDAIKNNLVTGTRTQNVGSTRTGGQYAGGMAYTELIARDYLDTGIADACPLYYAATPKYDGDELVPQSVIVDMKSCDGSIDTRVEVYNVANGWAVDYFTGEFTQE